MQIFLFQYSDQGEERSCRIYRGSVVKESVLRQILFDACTSFLKNSPMGQDSLILYARCNTLRELIILSNIITTEGFDFPVTELSLALDNSSKSTCYVFQEILPYMTRSNV